MEWRNVEILGRSIGSNFWLLSGRLFTQRWFLGKSNSFLVRIYSLMFISGIFWVLCTVHYCIIDIIHINANLRETNQPRNHVYSNKVVMKLWSFVINMPYTWGVKYKHSEVNNPYKYVNKLSKHEHQKYNSDFFTSMKKTGGAYLKKSSI